MFNLKSAWAGLCSAIFICNLSYAAEIGHVPISLDNALTHSHTTQGLEPIQDSYQIAKLQFLPDLTDSETRLGGITPKNDCSSYPLKTCPTGAKCSKCPVGTGYKLNSCSSPYLLSGGTCVCPAAVTPKCTNDKCVQRCSSSSSSGWLSHTVCVKTSCEPSPDETDCTRGTQLCDNGCCQNTRKCCIPCSHTITTKPANSSYVYSSCIDGDGIKDIQTGWQCNSGYHKVNETCVKDCNITNCSGYTLTSCPANATCSSCTKTAANCSTDGTVYKIDSCKNGYVKSGDTCACKPLPDLTPICLFGTKDASDGCGGTRKVCAASPAKILYSDHTVCQHVLPGKTAIAVIHDEANKKALALTWVGKSWADAIAYAQSHKTEGTSVGDWYAGSKAEYKEVRAQHDSLNPTIIALNNNDTETRIHGRGWTGEAADRDKAYVYYIDAKTEDAIFKTELKSAGAGFRPILDYNKYAITYCEEDGLTPQQKCLDEGYRLKEDWPKPTASNETVIPSSMLANFMKNIIELKSALAVTTPDLAQGCPASMKKSCQQNCTSNCQKYYCCGAQAVIEPIGPVTGGDTGGTTFYTDTAAYTFTVTATCPYDSNYVKGEWKIVTCNVSGCQTCVSGSSTQCAVCKSGYELSGYLCIRAVTPGISGCNGTWKTCNGKEYCCTSGAKTPCDAGYTAGSAQCFMKATDQEVVE